MNVQKPIGLCIAVVGALSILIAGCTGASTNLTASPPVTHTTQLPAPTPGKAIATPTHRFQLPSSSSSSAIATAKLLADARKASATVKYVHTTGTFLAAAPSPQFVVQPPGTRAVLQSYDMCVASVGRGNTSSVFGEGWVKGPGFFVNVIHIDDKTYTRGNAGYYRLLGPKAVAVTGQWLVDTFIEFPEPTISSPQGTAVYPESTLLPSISSQMQLIPNPPLYGVSVTRGPERLWDGKSVIPLHFSGNGFPPADLYLAATGTPYPVRAMTTEANIGWGETANYSQYNVPFTVKAPVGAIDIHSVQQNS